MIIVLFIAIIITAGLVYISDREYWDGLNIISWIMFSISAAALVITGMISIVAHVGADAGLAGYQQTRESLVYQLENDLYDNDNDLGKKELYDQILDYNKDVAAGRKLHDNFWTRCFCPDIYDELEFIEIDRENT